MRVTPWKLLLIACCVLRPDGCWSAPTSVQDGGDGDAAPTRSQVPAIKPHGAKLAEENRKPIELTARNFGKNIGDGHIWLIEFYSPNCVHCMDFASAYQAIASTYHTTNKDLNIKVARINGDEERTLSQRFGIYAYPTFYVVDGLSVYEFTSNTRTKRELMKFAEGKYKQSDPIPFYASPMGPMGLMQGALISMGVALADLFEWTEEKYGLSPMATGGILFGSLFMSTFFAIVFLAVIVTPKIKSD